MPSESHKLFSLSFGSSDAVALSVGSNGSLALQTRAVQRVEVFSKSKVTTSRWTHITLVYHKHRSSHRSICMSFKFVPTVCLTVHGLGFFVDGILSDTLRCAYPKLDEASPATFKVGDDVATADSSWCLASAYLLSVALGKRSPSTSNSHQNSKYTT